MAHALPPLDILACPLCGMPFTQQQKMLRCTQGHTFDIAREGYVNVVRKKLPGDTKEMLQARRSFFDQGYYQPLSDTLNDLVNTYLPSDFPEPLTIFDAGCGEGYYIGRLSEYLRAQGKQVLAVGCDISKEAIRMAAKRYPSIFFLVANLKEQLPIKDKVLHVMLNVFAPRNVSEYARVLAPGALLLVVIPGVNHLQQLRATLKLLNIEENKQQHVIEQFAPHFDVLSTQNLTYDLLLKNEEIALVVMMTPNYWHLSEELRSKMAMLDTLVTTIDFTCLILSRRREV